MDSEKSGVEKVLDGSLFGYAHWFQPIEAAFGNNPEPQQGAADLNRSTETGKVRGRPRKTRDPDNAAREKRRAQIRSAQKTYRERKERATASKEQRCDELLRVLSDLSTELEELLQVACNTGAMDRQDELGGRLRQTTSCYDSVIEQACVDPELRVLRTKSRQRRESYRGATMDPPQDEEVTPRQVCPPLAEPVRITTQHFELDLGRIGDTSLVQSFKPHPGRKGGISAKTILEMVDQRQADLKAGLSNQPLTSMSIDIAPVQFGSRES